MAKGLSPPEGVVAWYGLSGRRVGLRPHPGSLRSRLPPGVPRPCLVQRLLWPASPGDRVPNLLLNLWVFESLSEALAFDQRLKLGVKLGVRSRDAQP